MLSGLQIREELKLTQSFVQIHNDCKTVVHYSLYRSCVTHTHSLTKVHKHTNTHTHTHRETVERIQEKKRTSTSAQTEGSREGVSD